MSHIRNVCTFLHIQHVLGVIIWYSDIIEVVDPSINQTYRHYKISKTVVCVLGGTQPNIEPFNVLGVYGPSTQYYCTVTMIIMKSTTRGNNFWHASYTFP